MISLIFSTKYNFFEHKGSDERQFNSPGIDLKITSIFRTKYGEYPEYHTSLDNLENVVTPEGLEGGYLAIKKAIEAIERNKFYKVTVLCEPMMSKRDLYPNLNTKSEDKESRTRMNFLSLCDGRTSLLEIAQRLNVPIWDLYEITDKLQKHKLIQTDE